MDDKTKRDLGKEARLWLLALVCAVPGAVVASRTGSWWTGAGAFLICLAVLGPLLWLYERGRRPRTPKATPGTPAKTPPGRPGRGGKPASVNQTYGQQKRGRRPPERR